MRARVLFFVLLASAAACRPASAVDLIASTVSITGIVVQAQPQVRTSAEQVLQIRKLNRLSWQVTGSVANGSIVHAASGSQIPASIRFNRVRWVSGGDGTTDGISISSGGTRITGPTSSKQNRAFDADYEVTLNVPALPRAGSYTGTLVFVYTEN